MLSFWRDGFRFAAPCVYTDARWSAGGIKLDERYRLPCFAELSGEILVESAAVFSTVRAQEIKKREFRVSSIGCRVSGVGCRVSCLGSRVGLGKIGRK